MKHLLALRLPHGPAGCRRALPAPCPGDPAGTKGVRGPGGLGGSAPPGLLRGQWAQGGPRAQVLDSQHCRVAEVVNQPQMETRFRESRGLLEEVVPVVCSRASHWVDSAVTRVVPVVSGAVCHLGHPEATHTPLTPSRPNSLGQQGHWVYKGDLQRVQLAQFHKCETTSVENIEHCPERAWLIAHTSL